MGFDTEPTGYAKTLLSDLRGADPRCHREDGVGEPDRHCHRRERALDDQIEALARETGRKDLHLVRDLPAGERTHWNDVLRASSPAAAEPLPR
jgi:hypothetical protein